VVGPLVGLQIALIAPNSYPVDQLDGSDDITDITLELKCESDNTNKRYVDPTLLARTNRLQGAIRRHDTLTILRDIEPETESILRVADTPEPTGVQIDGLGVRKNGGCEMQGGPVGYTA
jgi:hypothetical protein